MYRLGHLCLEEPKADGSIVRTWWERAAAAGHCGAMYELGWPREELLEPPDLAGACHWYGRAADAGDIEAMRALGLIYGHVMDPPDSDSARQWFHRAADAGDADA